MVAPSRPNALQGWASVTRWTLLGTLGCMFVSVTFCAIMFRDLGPQVMERAIISAIILPMLLGGPLLFYLSKRMRGLTVSNFRLGLIARTDSLTGCFNRGAFTARVSAHLDRAGLAPKGALLMIDADNFKAINDQFGHDSGDTALTIIARSIRAVLPTGELVGRMGGEEFGVYLPDMDQFGAKIAAERIRRSVYLAVFTPQGRPRPLSVSIGGAVFDGSTSFSQLFRVADQNLYDAKRNGRNRIVVGHVADHAERALSKAS